MWKHRAVPLIRRDSLWPLVSLLLLVVAVPTACVLWFMMQAVRNERLAVRQRLSEVYRNQLMSVGQKLDAFWKDKQAALEPIEKEIPSATFARLVRSGVADSVVIFDPTGQVRYPAESASPWDAEDDLTLAWQQAEQLEFASGRHLAAATAYLTIADEADDPDLAAQARLAQARCLAKAGQNDAALEILTARLRDVRYRNARDRHGNLIVPGAQLFALDLLGEPEAVAHCETVQWLSDRLNDYDDLSMPADQRRFLMQRLRETVPNAPPFPTLDAENLAAAYLEAERSPPETARLTPTGLPDVWQLPSADGTMAALFRGDRLRAQMQALIDAELPLPDSLVEIVPPGGWHGHQTMPQRGHETMPQRESGSTPFLTLDAGRALPDWNLALRLTGSDPFTTAANRQVTLYLWTGLLAVAAVAALSGVAARYVSREIRLTRLKNDLLATVSHELKTPLSSIRALADTLLEGRCPDAGQQREYLQLITRENERLSRLIDNFLAFSRMERNKRSFEFAEIRIADCVEAALQAEHDKFASPGCRLDVEVAPNLPLVVGDPDALVTVLTNLLDNAYKYTGEKKRIVLAAYAEGGAVCLEVRDNGIGLSRRSARKIFDHFYQVDRSLSRRISGCGLGLSIVQFIVNAHDGSVTVDSEPGRGSTFRVTLPAAESQTTKLSER